MLRRGRRIFRWTQKNPAAPLRTAQSRPKFSPSAIPPRAKPDEGNPQVGAESPFFRHYLQLQSENIGKQINPKHGRVFQNPPGEEAEWRMKNPPGGDSIPAGSDRRKEAGGGTVRRRQLLPFLIV
jgi:hypothetical protein